MLTRSRSLLQLLVNFSRETIQSRLVTSLYKPDLFAELLFEDEALVSERTRVKALLDAYKEAFRSVPLCVAPSLDLSSLTPSPPLYSSFPLPRVLSEVTNKSG